MPYCVPTALRYGQPQVYHFFPDYFRDPKTLELMLKITVEVTDEALQAYPEAMLDVVEVVTKSGQRYRERVPHHKGHYKNPMNNEEFEGKFRSLAQGLLSDSQIRELLERLWNLEQVDDIGEVMELLRI